MIYETGKPFPHPNLVPGAEVARVQFTSSFIDVVLYANNITTDELQTFRKGSLTYGIFQEKNVPFMVFDLSGWTFDCSINLLKVPDDKADQWLNNEGNILTLFLVDAQSNVLLAMRQIGAPHELSEYVRDILDNQVNGYESPVQVDSIITQLTNSLTTDQMIKKSKLWKTK